MKAYRVSTNLKLGLIGFAVLIAVASLWYTNYMVDRLRERETSIVQLWARALAQVPKAAQQGANNPYQQELRDLDVFLSRLRAEQSLISGPIAGLNTPLPPADTLADYRQAIAWAQSMPPTSELTFILEAFLEPNAFGIPAVLYDSTLGQPTIWRNVDVGAERLSGLDSARAAQVEARLQQIASGMAQVHDPIPIEVSYPNPGGSEPIRLVQRMYYGESALVKDLRWFPYVQLLFVGLFVLVGYVGFSYVRRSEQSSLWVGMAKEAAHQLGTPISSLMGWVEVLRMEEAGDTSVSRARRETFDEIEQDIDRLRRVASRFSDIGSLPKLEVQPVGLLVESTTEYMRRRLPASGSLIRMNVAAPHTLYAPLNAELFEWVIENLLKNAMDAIETERGLINVRVSEREDVIRIDVSDTGRGIDRREWKNIFRPGYSTKKRGWGLGLSLAKRIVEDYHGGTLILAASKPGEGSTFRVEIPSAPAP